MASRKPKQEKQTAPLEETKPVVEKKIKIAGSSRILFKLFLMFKKT